MPDDNKKKTIINFVSGLGSQMIVLILGLVVPRIILTNYGSDTNGLISTITQIFTYMALLEAGISASSRNALYKPIKENDKQGISYWLSASRRYYRRISAIYFAAVIVMALAAPFVIKTAIDYWTIFVYTFFEGLTSVISFYFINTWTCFLGANGKQYIVTWVGMLTKLLCYTVRIVLSLLAVNISYIQVGYFLVSLVQLFIYYTYMKKKYGWIDYKTAPKDVKLPDRNAYIVTEIAWTIFSSTDMIVLSMFVSTKMSSVYSVYNMVFVALNGLLNAAYAAVNYNLGHAYVTGIEQYKKVHSFYHSFFVAAMTVLMCVAYIMIIPFVKLYTVGVTDVEYINKQLPLMFCLVQLLSWSRYVAGNLSGIAGYAKQTSNVSLIEALINITGSVILVNYLGIVGVLIATVIALPLKVVYLNWLADRKVMKRSPKKTIMTLTVNYLIFGATVVLNEFISIPVNSYVQFFIYSAGLFVIYLIITFALNALVNKDMLKLTSFLKGN